MEKRFFVHVQVSMHTWDPSPWKDRRERATPAACGPQEANRGYVSACVFSTKSVHWCPFRGMNEHVTPLLCSVVQGYKWKEPQEQPLLMVGVYAAQDLRERERDCPRDRAWREAWSHSIPEAGPTWLKSEGRLCFHRW